MSLYVYHTKNQLVEFEQLMQVFPHAIAIDRTQDLTQLNPEILFVLLSQPSTVYAKEINRASFRKLIVYGGIRLKGKGVVRAQTFEEMTDLIQRDMKEVKASAERAYQNNLQNVLDLSEEEQIYLNSLTEKNKKNRFRRWHLPKRCRRVHGTPIGLITLMGSSQSVSDFAKNISSQTGSKVLLIDGNLLNPSMDVHFGLNRLETGIKSHLTGIDNTGINIALDAISKQIVFSDILPQIVHKINSKLDLMLGNYNLYNYEHYDIEAFKRLIETLRNHYSLILLHVSDMPYDALAMLGFHLSKLNIIICEDSTVSLRYGFNIIEILQTKQQISSSKFLTILDAGSSRTSKLEDGTMKEIFGKRHLGTIRGGTKKRNRKIRKICEIVMERRELWG